jgi:uncharacterized protein (DUF427 family)
MRAGTGQSSSSTRHSIGGMHGHAIELHDEPRRVSVSVDGVEVAASQRAVTLLETGLPARHYFPREDVRMDLLEPTPTETACPFKGQASYFTLRVGDTVHRDIAWSYEDPIAGMEGISGRVSFFTERADVSIEGDAQARPVTVWSPKTS